MQWKSKDKKYKPSEQCVNQGQKCMLHGPGNHTEEYKVLMDYTEKNAGQWPYK